MNWHHFRAFLWLHWRLRVNQIKRGGIANQIILAILAVKLALLAVVLFVGSFLIASALDSVSPSVHMFIWDGLIFAFLTWWSVGLLVDLQRSEALSLEKFLHLPVSLWGVFVLNYLASLLSVNLILFVPAMVGFSLGLVFAQGPAMLLLLPLVASFLLMVTALSYQFQGWLASLMVDKRRRRMVIFIVTAVFVLVFQLPNLVNFIVRPWEGVTNQVSDLDDLDRAIKEKEITGAEAQKRLVEAQKRRQEGWRETWKQAERIGWVVNLALPPGWLPLGAMGLADGNVVPAILGTLGLSLIGGASLWRAYRTTLRLYTGEYTTGRAAASIPLPVPAAANREQERPKASDGLIAWKLPWLSEPASAIALAGLRSLTRAPEARMLLLTPIFMVVVFAGMFWRGSLDMPEIARPLLAFGAISMVLLSLVQLVGNQFGFDRGGFRVYVLSPASRADILLGKNLSVAPLALLLVLPMLTVIQVMHSLRLDHFLALAPQFASMYFLYCALANILAIYAPMPVAAGSLRASKTSLLPAMIQFLFTLVLTSAQAVTLLPLGVEFVLDLLEWRFGIPVCLLLTVAECAVIAWLYRRMLLWQGVLLQRREQRILEVVTTKAE